MTKLIGLFGYPLEHSISPSFQQAAIDYHRLPFRYETWPVHPDSLAEELDRLRGERYVGANVTIPHKEAVVAMLDDTDEDARNLGAVNTITKDDGKLVGHNTDAYGFLESLKVEARFEPRDKVVLLLGAGGAARAAAFALAAQGVRALTIANRTPGRALRLADALCASIPTVKAISDDKHELERACDSVNLIVNATSVGMRSGGTEGEALLNARQIPSNALVFDMVYTPNPTPLMREADKAGARSVGGLWMLVHQGAAAFEKWTGRTAPVELMHSVAEGALAAQ